MQNLSPRSSSRSDHDESGTIPSTREALLAAGSTPSDPRASADLTSAIGATDRTQHRTQRQPRDRTQRQHRPGVKCTGCSQCFYCDRALARHRHEHDHFPIPFRHGGEDTVPTCLECHSLKDRTRPLGMGHDRIPDAPVLVAIEAGMSPLPPVYVADGDGQSLPLTLWVLHEGFSDLADLDRIVWDGSDTLRVEVEDMGSHVHESVRRCTTPEARIFLARAFALWLDMIDDLLRRGS